VEEEDSLSEATLPHQVDCVGVHCDDIHGLHCRRQISDFFRTCDFYNSVMPFCFLFLTKKLVKASIRMYDFSALPRGFQLLRELLPDYLQ
jgi:hypothetical protein